MSKVSNWFLDGEHDAVQRPLQAAGAGELLIERSRRFQRVRHVGVGVLSGGSSMAPPPRGSPVGPFLESGKTLKDLGRTCAIIRDRDHICGPSLP